MRINVLGQRYEVEFDVQKNTQNDRPVLILNAIPVDRQGNITAESTDATPFVVVERHDCSFLKAMDALIIRLVNNQMPETIVAPDKVNAVRDSMGCSMREAKRAIARSLGDVTLAISSMKSGWEDTDDD